MNDKKHVSTSHILTYIGIFGSVEVLKKLTDIARGKITAYFLGPFGAGMIAIYQNVLDMINACTNIGLETASIQQMSEIDSIGHMESAKEMARVIRTWSMAVACLNILGCIIVALWFGPVFFSDGKNHTAEILMLAPAAFLFPITAGECAILKGLKRLKRVATVELLSAIGAVICTLGVYPWLGTDGIILTLNLFIAIAAFTHLFFCVQLIPYRIAMFSADTWRRGIPLLKFGIPYAVTAIMGAVTTTLLYKIITSTHEVGLYKIGYMLILAYVGMIFSSNSTDYFPRLTSVCHDTEQKNETVNKQIRVSFTITTPLVMIFLLCMPAIVVALYTREFLPIVEMCVLAGLFQLHRSVALPLEYVSLAHGHSWMFLILEGIYNILIISGVYLCYEEWGLNGIGFALSAVGIVNTLILILVNRAVYGVSITHRNMLNIALGTALVLAIILLCTMYDMQVRLGIGVPLTLFSALYSYRIIRKDIRNEK